MAITMQQRAFIEEYLKCKRGGQAAIRAGYSEKSVQSVAWRLLAMPEIAEEIERRIAENAMEANEVLSRLADMARGSIEDFITFTPGGQQSFGLDLEKAKDRNVLHLIHELSYDRNGNPKIKLYDAKDALKTLLDFFTRGPTGSASDPVYITYIKEVRPDDSE